MAECEHFFTRKGIGGSVKVLVCLRQPWRWPRTLTVGECDDCGHNTVPAEMRGKVLDIKEHPAIVHAAPPRTARREIPLTEIARIGQEERSSPAQHK